jgi:5-methyltetrahydrofolate--homocysteine methyltransferase
MGKRSIIERLKDGVFFIDGATGTELLKLGVEGAACNELLNVESADMVAAVHKSYFEAGSDAVLTNTFGSSSISLSRHGLAEEAARLSFAGAELAVKLCGDDQYVIGDIGPCGDFLEPVGEIKPAALRSSFLEQAEALARGGVDAFIVETMTALDEVEVAVSAAKEAADELPVFVSMAYDRAGNGEIRTMMGVSPEDAVGRLVKLGVTGVGFNCGTLGMDDYVELAEHFSGVIEDAGGGLLLLAEPNAGRPEVEDGKAVYKLSAADYAEKLVEIYDRGARIVGGCCGTTPGHIAEAVRRIRG